jgi:hypothetical protein
MSYTVIYRMGGRARCWWNRVFRTFDTKSDAETMRESIELMGYRALVHETDALNAAGMPEGWGDD